MKKIIAIGLLLCTISCGFFLGGFLAARKNVFAYTLLNQKHLLSASAGAGAIGTSDSSADESVPAADVFAKVLEHVTREYIDAGTTQAKLGEGTVSSMIASLNDPNSVYLDSASAATYKQSLSGHYEGIGVKLRITRTKTLDVEYLHLSVSDVVPNSPADKAGINTGDNITEIDGHWIIAYTPAVERDRIIKLKVDDAAKNAQWKKVVGRFRTGYSVSKALPFLIAGTGKELKLKLERAGKITDYKITSGVTSYNPTTDGGNTGTLVLDLRHCYRQSLDHALELIKVSQSKNILIDLRGCEGGLEVDKSPELDCYQPTLDLIGALADKSIVGKIEKRPGKLELMKVSKSGTGHHTIAILVDAHTSNLAELTAVALRDTSGAKILGAKTSGDGIVRSFHSLNDGTAVVLSHAKLYSLAGVPLSNGITPDVPFSLADEAGLMAKAQSLLGNGR